MKNMFTETDTEVSMEIRKWLDLHKEEFKNSLSYRHECIMFDEDSNMYRINVSVRKVEV